MYTVMLYNKIIYKYVALEHAEHYKNIFCFVWCQGTTTDAQTLNGF